MSNKGPLKTTTQVERDILENEWKECRETVRNFDRTLSWHRVYSIIVIVALMGIATDLFIRSNAVAALITGIATLFLLVIVFFLERHYRDFMLVTVQRAIRLEEELKRVYKDLGVDLEKITIQVDCEQTHAMISDVIKKKRGRYHYFKREAHTLMYVFLGIVCLCLTLYFLYSLFCIEWNFLIV